MSNLIVPRRLPVSRLSHSSLARYLKCPEQWRRYYLDRERSPDTLDQAGGNAVGAAITYFFAERLQQREPTVGEVLEQLYAEWEMKQSRIPAPEDPQAARLRAQHTLEQAQCAVRLYLSHVVPQMPPVTAVERAFELRFPGAEWTFTGYVDIVTDRFPIDTKFKGRKLSQQEADSDLQVDSYLLERWKCGLPHDRFDFHTFVRYANASGRGVRFEQVTTFRTERQLIEFERLVAETARRIDRSWRTGDWGYSGPGWWCGKDWCHVWDTCPRGGLDQVTDVIDGTAVEAIEPLELASPESLREIEAAAAAKEAERAAKAAARQAEKDAKAAARAAEKQAKATKRSAAKATTEPVEAATPGAAGDQPEPASAPGEPSGQPDDTTASGGQAALPLAA